MPRLIAMAKNTLGIRRSPARKLSWSRLRPKAATVPQVEKEQAALISMGNAAVASGNRELRGTRLTEVVQKFPGRQRRESADESGSREIGEPKADALSS